jgi:hypothetical protein
LEHDRKVAIEKAIEEAHERIQEVFVKNLLKHTDFPISKIAGLANVSESFVRKVKKSI